MSAIKLSVCIVNWNTKDLLRNCLHSLFKNVGIKNFEVLVVDNNSQDSSVNMIQREFPNVKLIINKQNVGYAKANNQMLKIAQGEYALLLNSDTIVLDNSIPTLINFMDNHPQAGACGPRLLNEDLTFQRSFMKFPTLLYELKYHLKYHFPPFNKMFKYLVNYKQVVDRQAKINSPIEVDAIPGACFLIRMKTYKDVGPMGEDYFLYSEENDWCWRMKQKGWKIYYVPSAAIIHLGGQSTKKAGDMVKIYNFYLSRYIFFKKYKNKSCIVLRALHIFFFTWFFISQKIICFFKKSKVSILKSRILLYKKLIVLFLKG